MRLEQREWEVDTLREQGHGRDHSTQALQGQVKHLNCRQPGEALEGVRVCPCMWASGARREGEIDVIGFTFLKEHCGSCV